MIDVAAVLVEASPEEVEALARQWGIRRIWDATATVVDALFLGGRVPWPLRTWARHLPRARERTVLEAHAASWLAAFWSVAPGAAARAGLAEAWTDLRPAHGEPAVRKLRRAGLAFRNSLVRRSAHDAEVERRALDAPHPIFGRDE
jgi:hypothetical protein